MIFYTLKKEVTDEVFRSKYSVVFDEAKKSYTYYKSSDVSYHRKLKNNFKIQIIKGG
jgi:hypothetical protein